MKTICLDFDGVIHQYRKGYHDGSIYDLPTEGTKEAIEEMLSHGFEVVIYTARPNWQEIKPWLEKNFGKEIADKVNIIPDKPKAILYVDDRAIRFTNWKDILNYAR